MNDHCTGTVAGNAVDATHVRAFLQQAVDHYPRLVAFSFTLVLPYRESMTDYRSLILRFHTEVWQRISEYSWELQQTRRNAPPTILRWIWEAASAPECKMVLMINLDTLGTAHDESAQLAMRKIIRNAWLSVTGSEHHGVTNITPIIINRGVRGAFTSPFNQLRTQVQSMAAPIATARTVICCWR
ncbi:inovirus-type Gp2 protein [Citrobacter amalonaticus]|uniref:YagK/YfjJ domain-containing protein n=1 Tax=Citrobacter amalonaticus TaxID=35703 RepID=UPI00292B7723|nr:inovirus-type Gp2 protein [Citrobacter amalonaticus]MDV0786208.1 inovirus-type Gp2 protein [Citrobacter amalonaticus]MEB0642271.1 inovirus-type Gp2 protein [Citrobacter amalonaticus]